MPRLLRTSERTAYARCRMLWWWSYEEGWRPKLAGPALRFGSLVHAALERRYPPGLKRGPEPAETFLQLYEKELEEQTAIGFRDEDGTWEDAAEIGVKMLEAFVNEYGDDERYRVISSEQTFRVRVTKRMVYVGTLDGIWQDRKTGHILLKEWKTTAQFWTSHLALDEQAGSYWAFAPPWLRDQGILAPNAELKGILYTFLRRAKPDERPRDVEGHSLNKDGSISKRQPPRMFERHLIYRSKFDRNMIRARAISQFEEMQMIREGKLSLTKTPTRFNCAGCPMLNVCELHETGADYQPLIRGAYMRYNPYAAHEIKEEGK